MDDGPQLVLVLLILFLVMLLAQGFFSGSETALLAFPRLRLRHLERQGDRRAKRLLTLLQRPERLLGTLLIGNNLAGTAGASIATYLAVTLTGDMERSVLYVTLGVTVLWLIVGEVTPKTFAAHRTQTVSFAVLPLVRVLMVVLAPAVWALTVVSNRLLRAVGIGKSELFSTLSEDEIRSLLRLSYEEARGRRGRGGMLYSVFALGETYVREVMVPRTEVVAVEVGTPVGEIVRLIQKTGFSRFPVYRGHLEEIVGVLEARDLLQYWERADSFALAQVLRPPYFVPESARAEGLLTDMQKNHQHLAIVVDEYGGFEGIVALEDLLEEIVGEIQEEPGREREPIVAMPDGSVVIEGRTPLRDVNDRLGLDLPEGLATTLGGLVLAHLGRVPEERETFTYQGLMVYVEKVTRRTVSRVRLSGLPAAEESGGDP